MLASLSKDELIEKLTKQVGDLEIQLLEAERQIENDNDHICELEDALQPFVHALHWKENRNQPTLCDVPLKAFDNADKVWKQVEARGQLLIEEAGC